MAVEFVLGANVTKYASPGGDNIIPDGYIKAIEKIWMDNYTLTSVITLTNTAIRIAELGPNRKITSIEIFIECTASLTSQTIALGHEGDLTAFLPEVTIAHNLTVATITLAGGLRRGSIVYGDLGEPKNSGIQLVTGAGTTGNITLKLNNWTSTTGTIKSIVRYT